MAGKQHPSRRQKRSAYGLDRLAVDAGLIPQIIDRHMRVVPGEARLGAESLRQFRDALLREPGLGRLAAVLEINAAGAGVAVQVVLPDQSLLA